jgi:hypothetical protein
MALLTEAVITILFIRAPKPHPPGLGLGLATLSICALVLGLGAFQGYRTVRRLRSMVEAPAAEAILIRASHLFFGIALVGNIAVIEGLMLVTGMLGMSKR